MLPAEQREFWNGVLQNYQNGIFTQELVLANLHALQGRMRGEGATPAPAPKAAAAPAASSGQGLLRFQED